MANHRALATTVRYVQGPEVEREHHRRIAALQAAFLGQIRSPTRRARRVESSIAPSPPPPTPSVASVSMFGFDCKDPLAGIAPGTHRGELCSHFLGCFTCPNAIISPDPASSRASCRRASTAGGSLEVHPARFEALYAPLLRILEE